MEELAIREILTQCISGQTVILVQENKRTPQHDGYKYFAVFVSFGQATKPETKEVVADWLELRTGKDKSRGLALSSLSWISIVAPSEVNFFLQQCQRILGAKSDGVFLSQPEKELEITVGFWNDLWDVVVP